MGAPEMLDRLKKEDFDSLLQESFRIQYDENDGAIEAILTDVRGLASDDEQARRPPFSVVFLGPEDPILNQGVYGVLNEKLGRLEVFLVPIGPERGRTGIRYEAIFT